MTDLSSHQVTSSVGSTPSIFEILAVESLCNGLRDAFKHLSKLIAESFPERIHGASFPERFYGLRRIPDARDFNVSNCKVIVMVCLQIVFPYVKLKLEDLYKSVKERELDGSLNRLKEFVKRLAVAYRIVYPWLHFVWEMLVLCYYMAYAVNKTRYPSPLFHLISTKLVNSNEEDFLRNSWDQKLMGQNNVLVKTIWKAAKLGVGGVTLSISAGAVLIQFLDWWYNREGGGNILQSMPIPPAPSKWPVQFSPHICPICLKRRSNDTILSCSGFVYCYPCIFHHLKSKQYCPVTGYPASMKQLIKIYHQDSS